MATKTTKRPSKKSAIAEIHKSEIIEEVSGLTHEGVATELATAQVSVQKTLADISAMMAEKLSTLRNLEGAIATREESLRNLHQIEVTALTLDELKGEIESTREGWQKEKEGNAQAEEDYEAGLALARGRDEEQYKYNQSVARRTAEDAFAAEITLKRKAENERVEALNKNWSTREQAIASAEAELTALRAQVAGFPEVVKKEVAREVAIATNSLKRDLETQHSLKNKDHEVNLKLAQQTVDAAKLEATQLRQNIAELREQLTKAHSSTQEIATKALEAGAGAKALETLQSSIARGESQISSSRRSG